MEFIPGEQYDLSMKEKEAVLERYRMKEVLKKEYLRREYDPIHFKYREGVIMDPAMFRWYAADMTQVEHFRWTPKTVFMYIGVVAALVAIYFKLCLYTKERTGDACRRGEILWWDRTASRQATTSGCNMAIDDRA